MQINSNNYLLLSFLSLLLVLLASCNENAADVVKNKTSWIDGGVSVVINKIKPFEDDNGRTSLVYATVELTNLNQKLQKANLDCVSIVINGRASKKVYVDSIAHILPDNYQLKGEITQIAVYWRMDNGVTYEDLQNGFEINIKSGCRLFI